MWRSRWGGGAAYEAAAPGGERVQRGVCLREIAEQVPDVTNAPMSLAGSVCPGSPVNR